MRVISGELKGRVIKGFTLKNTRPTMDRVKESIFSIIQNKIPNSICLDLFSGSGSLGIEAISNGSKQVYFVDNNKFAINTINDNISNFGIKQNSEILKMDYNEALNYFKNNNIFFDIIFLDPPYDMHIINNILEKIEKFNLINDDGIIVCEVDSNYLLGNLKTLKMYKNKKYGSTFVYFYKFEK